MSKKLLPLKVFTRPYWPAAAAGGIRLNEESIKPPRTKIEAREGNIFVQDSPAVLFESLVKRGCGSSACSLRTPKPKEKKLEVHNPKGKKKN